MRVLSSCASGVMLRSVSSLSLGVGSGVATELDVVGAALDVALGEGVGAACATIVPEPITNAVTTAAAAKSRRSTIFMPVSLPTHSQSPSHRRGFEHCRQRARTKKSPNWAPAIRFRP